jgi:hypothetical protein
MRSFHNFGRWGLVSSLGIKYILVHAFSGDDFEAKRLPTLLNGPRLRLAQVFPSYRQRQADLFVRDPALRVACVIPVWLVYVVGIGPAA